MEINELLAGFISALFMLPISILFSYIFKAIITPVNAAKIISFIASIIYLVIGISPVTIASKYNLIEVVAYSHGFLVYLIVHLLIGLPLIYYGVHMIFKSSNKALNPDAEKTPRPLA